MNKKTSINKKLNALNPQHLEIADESHKHAGHAGNPNNSGESHFKIIISAETLNGKTPLEQHRIINKLLEEEFNQGLHALSIKVI